MAQKTPCSVVIVVDAVSRKYFTSETSWLWDINFEQLDQPQVESIYLCGKYCNDLATRFSFTKIPQEKLKVFEDIDAACADLREHGDQQLYAVTCFSDKDKLMSNVTVK